jgi:REP-associated tyrosine transposase
MDLDRHHRQSVRLKGHDYAGPGAYFVTACTRDRERLLGDIVDGETRLNEAGEIARRCWEDIRRHFPHVALDARIIMPNHVHGIIVITEFRRGEASGTPICVFKAPRESDASPLRQRPNGTQPGSLCAIVQNFKSISTRRMNAARGTPGTPVWQRNYYEHVIRSDTELSAIRQYTLSNPANWTTDENYHP